MKNTLLLMFLLMAGVVNSQIISFTDPVFKAKLVDADLENAVALDSYGNPMVIDSNNDGEIQLNEAELVYYIHVGGAGISSVVGIESFTNLKEFVGGYNDIAVFDASALSNLETLAISFNPTNSINVEGLQNLRNLWVGFTAITSMTLNDLPNLEQLDCQGNGMTSLSVANMPLLEEILCNDNMLSDITLSGLPSLRKIDCNNNLLTTLDLTVVPSLLTLYVGYNPLTSLDVSPLPDLKSIYIRNSMLTEINLDTCHDMSSIILRENEQLEWVNIKNGDIAQFTMIIDNPLLEYICLDEGEEDTILAMLDLYEEPPVVFNTYCTNSPAGDYNTIAGAFYFDADGIGCDLSEQIDSFVSISISDGNESEISFSSDGTYNFYTQAGNFIITPNLLNDWFTATPSSATINLPTVDNSTTPQDFCLTANGVHPDVEVAIIPFGAQPGFDASYKIIYQNKGNQVMAGDIVFTYNDNVLDYVSASPAEDASATGSLTWSYTNLLPFQSREINVVLNVNGPMETPAVNIGDDLGFLVNISPNANDETPSDNSFDLKQEVVGSFDPNDITCLEGDTVHPDMIGEYLHYNINFENTGDAAATFIVVKDIINEEQFDVSSLQMLYTSHDMEVRVEDNKVEFFFDDIDLGPLEKGNVTFKIKTLNTLQVNDNVMQQAEIFFDYNWPIETNEANTVFAVLSSGGFELDATVKVYPNPAVDLVTIEAATALQSVQLYDVAGRLLQTALVNDTQASIDIASRAAGVYFVKITTEKGGKVEKIIKR